MLEEKVGGNIRQEEEIKALSFAKKLAERSYFEKKGVVLAYLFGSLAQKGEKFIRLRTVVDMRLKELDAVIFLDISLPTYAAAILTDL